MTENLDVKNLEVENQRVAHATRSLTALTPRNLPVTPLVCTVQRGVNGSVKRHRIATLNMDIIEPYQ